MKLKTTIMIVVAAYAVFIMNVVIIKTGLYKTWAFASTTNNEEKLASKIEEVIPVEVNEPTTTTSKIIETSTTTKKITTTQKTTTEVIDKIIFDNLNLEDLTKKLNKNLKSTLSNTGNYFASYTDDTGLDPYLAVAIVLHETGCKWTCSSLVTKCNNIGGIKGKPSCNGGSYRSYSSLEEGIKGFLNLLYKNYYSKGLTTAEQINTKYATSTSWSGKINKYYETIKNS